MVATVVVLDLTDTTFLDATALSSFVEFHKHLRANGGGTIRIVGGRPHIRRLFAITGLEKIQVVLGLGKPFGDQLAVAVPERSQLRRIFDILGLRALLHVVASIEAAFAYLGHGSTDAPVGAIEHPQIASLGCIT